MDFLRLQFIPQLNVAIRQAARDTGVNLIDIESSYDGFRVCEVSFKAAALNVIAVSKTPNGTTVGNYLHNSFHPNSRGHKLASTVVFEAVTRTSGNPAPTVTPPPNSIPATIPEPQSVPDLALQLFDCATQPDFVLTDTATKPDYVVSDANPSSLACILRNSGVPSETRANAIGQLPVQVAKGEQVEIRYLDNTGRWNQLTVTR